MSNLTLGTLGPYQLLSLLGTGGMAEVYRARDPRLDREVAIKVLPADLARQPGFLERFRREARNVARLDHPNIVPIYDFGEDRGAPYVVMPLIEGGTLRDRIAQNGACPLQEAASIIYQLALALEEAHRQGLVHRDVKPANVLLAPGERVLLADFGIACALAEERAAPLTQAGMGIGTAEYMSPEQARGEPVDHRADIYALGIVFFQALTGQVPFSAADHFTTALMQVYEDPPKPRSLNPTIPPAVEALILKALKKDPAQRFQSASEFAEALAEAVPWLQPGSASHPSGPQPAASRTPNQPATHNYAAFGQQMSAIPSQTSWSAWPSALESESLTLPAFPGMGRDAGWASAPGYAAAGEMPDAARPARRRHWFALVGVVLALLLIGGAFATATELHLWPGQSNMALSPHAPAPTMTPVRPSPPPPTSTPVPQGAYYMADFFTLQQGDLQPGDRLGKTTAILNNQYQEFEGQNGTIYHSGAATQFGRAFGTGTVIRDKREMFRFVVLVDRFGTPTQAQHYYQYEVSLLSQTTPVQVGEQAQEGLARVMADAAVYRLVMQDRNIVVTFATSETQMPLAFQTYFAGLAQILDQRGHRCQYTAQLQPVPGSPAMCQR